MAQPYLRRIYLKDLDERDMKWLLKGVESFQDGTKPRHVMEDVSEGYMQLWRVEGAAEGIMVTQLIRKPAFRVLEIWTLAGKGLFPQYGNKILEECRDVARKMGADRIYCGAESPALEKLYERRLGMQPKARRFVAEV
jgi:hypothetical protein